MDKQMQNSNKLEIMTKEKNQITSERNLLRQQIEKLNSEKNQITSERNLLGQQIEKLNSEKNQITSEFKFLKKQNKKLIKEKDQITPEFNLLKQQNKKLIKEKDLICSERNLLGQQNEKLIKEKDLICSERNLLRQQNEKLNSDFDNFKNSIKNFISSIDLGINQHLREEWNKLTALIEQSKEIRLKEVRKIKLSENSCLSDKSFYEEFLCSVCLDFIEDPVCCSSCEILNCRECIDPNKPCPNCGKNFAEASIQRIIRNQLRKLNFKCPLACSQQFMYENRERHFSECINRAKIRPKCSLCDSFLTEDLTKHSKTCEILKIKCLYCNQEMSKLDLEQHVKECKTYTRPCEICKTGFPNRFEKAHSEYYCNKIVGLKKQIDDFIQFN